jgi:hypothetical protein
MYLNWRGCLTRYYLDRINETPPKQKGGTIFNQANYTPHIYALFDICLVSYERQGASICVPVVSVNIILLIREEAGFTGVWLSLFFLHEDTSIINGKNANNVNFFIFNFQFTSLISEPISPQKSSDGTSREFFTVAIGIRLISIYLEF